MPRIFAVAALLALAACGDAADAPAPNADGTANAAAVADAMLAQYQASLGGVDDFAVVAAGAEARYVAAEDDSTGLDRFGSPQISAVGDGEVPMAAQLLLVQVPNVPRLAQGLRTAEVQGPIRRDGRSVYVFSTDDPGVLVGEPGNAPADSASTRAFRVYVAADTYDVYEIYQSVTADSLDVTSRIIYSDFRDVDGVRLPFSIRQVETGLNAGISSDEKMLMGGQLGLALRQAQASPAGPERDARIAELEAQQRLIGEGIMDSELTVDEVRVGRE
ncbi:hypothetical protein [Rubrivirga sp. IMCC45206]|uniref:hypothetical protein n=1 Tax=Rubrivirga sp. IMCC45206 TaxID=3391614 RepID=UPI00398FBC22